MFLDKWGEWGEQQPAAQPSIKDCHPRRNPGPHGGRIGAGLSLAPCLDYHEVTSVTVSVRKSAQTVDAGRLGWPHGPSRGHLSSRLALIIRNPPDKETPELVLRERVLWVPRR